MYWHCNRQQVNSILGVRSTDSPAFPAGAVRCLWCLSKYIVMYSNSGWQVRKS